jgi:hypothetical protein
MSVRVEGDVIHLEGDCGVEDAEPLASALEAGTFSRVDVSLCRHLHSAVVQALIAFRSSLEGDPTEGGLTRFVLPALAEAIGRREPPKIDTAMERSE